MALKKSDLYRSLWQSCDELRGGMDASQYKDYILTLLFVKYVTDKAKSDPNSLIDVPDGGSFDDMVALKGDTEIGDRINKIIGRLAEANDLQRVIDLADFNDEEKLGKGTEMQDRLSKLVAIFADLDFRGSRAEGDDLLGDAYEYLMRHFATESGKSKGQFYTPAEVSRVIAKIVGIGPGTRRDQRAYDPTCGSGSLLLKVAAEAPRGITIYGQEKDNATWALSRMNMILHENEDADIRKGDTITSPQFVEEDELRTFDFAVANPPFSEKSWSNGLENDYGHFEYGRPPEKNGDYAFLLHVLKSLNSTGKAAVILPHGVLFRGHAEAAIRRQLLDRGFIKGIVGLPPNLFYGTGIPACIVVLDKENAQARTGVFMIDASKGFVKDGPKNRLRSQDIHKIVDVFNKQTEPERFNALRDRFGVTDRELLLGAAETPVEGVLADNADRRRRRDDSGRTVVAVHQQHVGPHGVAADLDVLGQRCEHPHAPAAVQAAGGLEVDRAAQELVDEPERFVVLHDPVALADDPELLAGVLTDGGVVAVDLLVAQHVGQIRALIDGERLLDDAPTEPRHVDRLRDTRRRSSEHGSKTVPRGSANREHRV